MQRRKKQSFSTKLLNSILSIDKYGEEISFTVKGKGTYPSLLGAFVSIVILAVIIPYGFNKFTIMQSYGDTSHQTKLVRNAVSDLQEFTYE